MTSSWRGAALTLLLAALALSACASLADRAPRAELGTGSPPLFDASIQRLTAALEARMSEGVPVPEPRDAGGGYTHEQHKQNAKTIYEAGMLYALTGEARHREFAAGVLTDYARMYPALGLHPQRKGQAPGRLFWQSLNEAVWLVYAIQGYEAVRDDLDPAVREQIEAGVLRPMAEFLSAGQPSTFNRIHNHGTWAAAAVGMTGYVLDEKTWVNQALYGLDQSGDAGFLRQMDELFSPDGYYAEGPYYQRYALMPFVLFAQAIERNAPERKIFERRDGVLLKAITTTVQLSYGGRLFPINDAIREKGLNTVELKYALAIAYDLTGDPTLLDIAAAQSDVVPTPEGRALARDLAVGKARPFPFTSVLLRDGSQGDAGALAVLRSGPERDAAVVVFKPTSHGMDHGHFDRLGMLYFDAGHEIVADYGAARFLNVDPKDGGRYLAENESWAKQSIAHNVLVVDEASQFGGAWAVAQATAPQVLAFGSVNGVQIAAAQSADGYDGVLMQRLIALAPRDGGGAYVIDVMRARADSEHSYDLPVHFKGQLIETSFEMDHATRRLEPLGASSGYEHLWRRAVSKPVQGAGEVSWLIDDQFYTLTFAAGAPVTAILAELGAQDPEHNLRREQALILRTRTRNADYVSVYERHGRYDNDEEVTVFEGSSIASVSHAVIEDVDVYSIVTDGGGMLSLMFAADTGAETEHAIELAGERIVWKGPVHAHR